MGIKKASSSIKVPAGGTGKGKIGVSSVVDCLIMKGVHFDTDKTFIKPSVKKALTSLANFANRPKERKLLVLGHTDTTARKSYNLDLSLRRAQRIYDFITFLERQNEQDAILNKLYEEAIKKEKWGDSEAEEILGQNGLMIIGLMAQDLPGAIEFFQKYRMSNKIPTGKLDDETWKELYKAYINHFGVKIPKDKFVQTRPYIGCGEEHLRIPTGDNVDEPENRRVEFLFFSGEPDPEDLKDCSKYDEWIKSKKDCTDVEAPCEISTIILSPALGVPLLGKPNQELEVIFLAINDLSSNEDYKSKLNKCWSYAAWKDKDNIDVSEPVDISSITRLTFQITDEGWVLEKNGKKLYKLSSLLMKKYKDKRFNYILLAKIKAPSNEGLYNLINPNEAKSTTGLFYPKETFDQRNVKIYHPFFISQKNYLNIGHITDIHVALRVSQFQKDFYKTFPAEKNGFCNWNVQFERSLNAMNDNPDIDMIIITGDLIDFNPGYDAGVGLPPMETEHFTGVVYKHNWNWVYFYMILLRNYKKPVFTILGNHEYLDNPYFYGMWIYTHLKDEPNYYNMSLDEMQTMYPGFFKGSITGAYISSIVSYGSVIWYNCIINPFMDYSFIYNKTLFLMLDWGKDWEIKITKDLPYPKNCISTIQFGIIDDFINYSEEKGINIKIVSTHAGIYHPYPEVGHKFLINGRVGKIDDNVEYDHPASAYFGESSGELSYFELDQLVDGITYKNRNKFIKRAIDKKITLVLMGHGHRNGIYQIEGDSVFFRKADAPGTWNFNKPFFVMTVSGGPMGIINEEGRLTQIIATGKIKEDPGKKRRGLVKPGYRIITFDASGKLSSLSEQKAPSKGDKDDIVRRKTASEQFGPLYPDVPP